MPFRWSLKAVPAEESPYVSKLLDSSTASAIDEIVNIQLTGPLMIIAVSLFRAGNIMNFLLFAFVACRPVPHAI